MILQVVTPIKFFLHSLPQAAVIAIEDSSERATDMMVQLLKSLTDSLIITPEMFTKVCQCYIILLKC